ncbi:hypothetical protein TPCV3_22080 [Cutibacterium avidum]
MSEKNPTTEPVISARSLDLVGSTEAAVEPSARGRYRAARNKLIDRGMATAEYAVGILATYIAPGRTYFTLAGVPVRTG